MNLYHGSDTIIKKPDLQHSRTQIDFGAGFYLTESKATASKWAVNKNPSILNTYVLSSDSMRQLNIKVFKLDEEWLSFVMANRTRTFPDRYKQYDIIVGAIADDKLYNTIALYEQGILSTEKTIQVINCMDYGNQWVFRTDKALNSLSFANYKELINFEKSHLVEKVRNERISAAQKTTELIKGFSDAKDKYYTDSINSEDDYENKRKL